MGPRVARRFINILTLLSAVLLAVTVTLWVRSFVVSDFIRREDGPNNLAVRASRGRVWVFRWSMPAAGPSAAKWSYASEQPAPIRDGQDPWVERYWRTPPLTFRG